MSNTENIHILHLEDSPRDAELIRDRLESEGVACEITRVSDREAFAAALATHSYELILCDYNLPQFDGKAGLNLASQIYPDAPVILISGTLADEEAVDCIKLGATDYILKHRLERLVPSVKRALRESRERQARERAEESVRQSEARYRALVETVFDWVWEVDHEGRYTYASQKVTELLGFTPEEVIGRTPFDFMPEEEAARVRGVFLEYATERRPFTALENINRRKDGQLVVLETSGAPIFGLSGEFQGYRGVDRDITRRSRDEEALRVSEERFRTLVDGAPMGIFVQTQGCFAYLNRAAVSLFGLKKPEQLLGRPVLDRFGPEFRPKVRERIRLVNEKRQPAPVADQKCLRLDGTEFEGEFMAVPFVYDSQPGALVFFRDITQSKQTEMQLRQAQKLEAIGQLAGGVAHDFNNILAAMLMHLGLLCRDQRLTAQQREDLEDLAKEAKRGASLARQLLAFSRRQILQPSVLDLNALLDNLLKMLRRLLGEHIEIEVRLEPGPVWIEADPGMIEQVVMNLCVNARDAMPEGGTLTLKTALVDVEERQAAENAGARAGGFVCLSVLDTGVGMDQATLIRVFEPFFTTKEVGKGTGLGLSTVHGIVQQHHGWIEVESQVGKGTTFRVYLPPGKAARQREGHREEKLVLAHGTETLLLVEDERVLRLSTAALLRQCGYQVLESTDAVDALRQWEGHGDRISLLITDMIMPGGLSGLQLAKNLRARKPGLGVIVCSGYSLELQSRLGGTVDGVTYLAKPFEPVLLTNTIRSMLDGPKSAGAAPPPS